MKRIVGFLFVVVLLIVGVYWLRAPRGSSASDVLQDVKEDARKAGQSVRDVFRKSPDAGAEKAKDESTSTRVVRKAREVGAKVADAASDARTTAAIKLKLAVDPDLSAWQISVDTTDGRVTLAGAVSSPDNIEKAIRIALAQDGVDEVVSTLQVDRSGRGAPAPPPVTTRRRSS